MVETLPPIPERPKGLPDSQTVAIDTWVRVQPGAIVSREILRRPTGTVTLFAFDAGQGLSEHTAPFDALVQGISGEAQITIAGQPHTVRPGELLLMPAGQPHAVLARQPFRMILTMIRS
ncbi:MAG: cupin domain-containing protein [Verrucomicrobiae bacterium]|nr:cupin domain-containing protein [Verrucomicrobiae bacterium]